MQQKMRRQVKEVSLWTRMQRIARKESQKVRRKKKKKRKRST
jgi:hypothetical protein